MARNKKFNNTYIVTISGTTTNGFMSNVIDGVIRMVVNYIDKQYKQLNADIRCISTNGEFNAKSTDI